MKKRKTTKNKPLIAIEAPIAITAAEGEDSGPPSFSVTAYTGGALSLVNFEYPVVVDLDGMSFGKSLVANLDHETSQRVGNVDSIAAEGGQLTLGGQVTAATDAAREVVESSKNGFTWQASIEAQPDQLTEVKAGKEVTVNGQEFTGPIYVAAKSTLKGFAFVSHGADDNTSVTIAASAAEENVMRKEVKTWIKAMLPSLEIDDLSEEEVEALEANYDGQTRKKTPRKKLELGDAIEAAKVENERVEAITTLAIKHCEDQPFNTDAVKKLAEEAIESKWTVDKFRLELWDAILPKPHSTWSRDKQSDRMNNKVLEAAVCMSGRLEGHEEMFDDRTLQAAHDKFPRGIGLGQLLLIGAEANGYRSNHSTEVTIEAQRAAFGMLGPQQIQASGFSTVVIPDVVAATANKFLHEGWMAVDMTPMAISAVRNVRNFQQTTTVSLTGHLQFEELGASGEIKHGTVADLTYTNQADTYAKMLAITRKDIINDDLGALTAVPRRLGRGGALKLNDIFWTVFLNNSTFFASGNSNVNTGVADMTIGGLTATEVIFMDQTDPDSKPLGTMPAILLVPTPLKAAAIALMDPQSLVIDGSSTAAQSNVNVFKSRFTVESSPYMSNSSYTGYDAAAWYMLANPSEMPVIEIAALNGNVMPVVETADADFNVLGIQMRGYSDIGVALQEYRGGVRADGGSS